ncbi:MAG: 23S rRNA (guanosine(2251)-2'-O)-methyltransferase, partial [uncultured Friedmanniella sp.]
AREQPAQGRHPPQGQGQHRRVRGPRPPRPRGPRRHPQGRGPPVPQVLRLAEGRRSRCRPGPERPRRAVAAHRASRHRSGVGGRPQPGPRGDAGGHPHQDCLHLRGRRARRPAARHPQAGRGLPHADARGDPRPARQDDRRGDPPGRRPAAAGVHLRPPRRPAGRGAGGRRRAAGGRARLDHRPPQPRGRRPLVRRVRRPRRPDPRAPLGRHDGGGVEDLRGRGGPDPDRPGHQPQPRAARLQGRRLLPRRPGRRGRDRHRRPAGDDRAAAAGRGQRGRRPLPAGPRGLRHPRVHPDHGVGGVAERGRGHGHRALRDRPQPAL